jgi:hypothetical protein
MLSEFLNRDRVKYSGGGEGARVEDTAFHFEA